MRGKESGRSRRPPAISTPEEELIGALAKVEPGVDLLAYVNDILGKGKAGPGEDLFGTMQALGMNKHELARIAGVSPAYLGYLQKGVIQQAGRDKVIML